MKTLGWIVAAALAVVLVIVSSIKRENVCVDAQGPPVSYGTELPSGFELEQPAPRRETLEEIYARTPPEPSVVLVQPQPTIDGDTAGNARMQQFDDSQMELQASEQTLQARRQADAAERQARATDQLARQGRGP